MAIEKEKMMAKGRLGYLRLVREQMKARVTGELRVTNQQDSPVAHPLTPAQRRWGKVRIFLRAGVFHSRSHMKKHESDSEEDIDAHAGPVPADAKPAEATELTRALSTQSSSLVSRLVSLSNFKSFRTSQSPTTPISPTPSNTDQLKTERLKKQARGRNRVVVKLASWNATLITFFMSLSDSSLYAIPNIDHEGLLRDFDSRSFLALPAAIYWCAYSNTQYICYFLFMLRYLQLRSGLTVIYPLVTLVIAVPYHPRPPRWFWIGISAYSALTLVIGTMLAFPYSKTGCIALGAPLNGNTVSDAFLYSLSDETVMCSASETDLFIFAMCILHISVIRRRGLWISELETRSGLEGPQRSLELDKQDSDVHNEADTSKHRLEFDAAQASSSNPPLSPAETITTSVSTSRRSVSARLSMTGPASTRLSLIARSSSQLLSVDSCAGITHTDSSLADGKLERQHITKGPTKRRDKLAQHREKMKVEKATGADSQPAVAAALFVKGFVEHLKGQTKLGFDLYTAMYTSQLIAFCNFVYVGFTMSSGGADISRNVIPLDTLVFPLLFFAVIVVDRYIYLKRNAVNKMALHFLFACIFFYCMQKGTFGSAESSYALYASRCP